MASRPAIDDTLCRFAENVSTLTAPAFISRRSFAPMQQKGIYHNAVGLYNRRRLALIVNCDDVIKFEVEVS